MKRVKTTGEDAICNKLANLFNKCLLNGKYPKAWENATITLIHEKR